MVGAGNRCFKRIEPGGYVDQWGRICGQLSNGTITCTSAPGPPGWTNHQYLWNNQKNTVPNFPYSIQEFMKRRANGTPAADLSDCG